MNAKVLDERQVALLEWIDNNATGIHQALCMAAESNAGSATKLAEDPATPNAVVQLLRESSARWLRQGQRFLDLYEAAFPYGDGEEF